MNLKPVYIREEIIKALRDYFYRKHFHEILTPTLQSSMPVEPTIYPFKTSWETVKGSKEYYLATSPESGIKKMLAQGVGNCFALSKSFRNLENAGPTHIPEFLMFEWYREQATYTKIIKDVEFVIKYICKRIDEYVWSITPGVITFHGQRISLVGEWQKVTMTDLFTKYTALSLPDLLEDTAMQEAGRQKGYNVSQATWEQTFNQIFLNEIEPHLGTAPCIITDFPARISPLCARKKDQPDFAERFEVYIAGMEIGNGNTESTDTKTIQSVFENEVQQRKRKKMLTPPIDTTFLGALETMKTHSYAGIGVGIDRLAMIFSDSREITDVEPLAAY